MATQNEQNHALELLSKLYECLSQKGESNWIRGVSAALAEMTPPTGEGFANARSIYRTMMEGGRGFAEYFVWDEDENRRLQANKEIDKIRAKLWEVFDS